MWVRRAFFHWMFPAAFVLPAWLLIGWIAFDAGGWALLWVLFLAIPSVFLGQLVLALLVRARGTVRAERAVSWWDVAGFGLWHALIVVTGMFSEVWFGPALFAAVVVAVALFWSTLRQLWREARGAGAVLLRTTDGVGYIPPTVPRTAAPRAEGDVIVVTERRD